MVVQARHSPAQIAEKGAPPGRFEATKSAALFVGQLSHFSDTIVTVDNLTDYGDATISEASLSSRAPAPSTHLSNLVFAVETSL